MTYHDQLNQIVDRYFEIHSGLATKSDIARWAIDEGLWRAPQDLIVRKAADDFAEAMRESYYVDPQGRSVRTKHAARMVRDGKQATFWSDLRSAGPEFMRAAFVQRRLAIVADCHQLKTDVDSYNDNQNSGKPIQLTFDFSLDLEELDAA